MSPAPACSSVPTRETVTLPSPSRAAPVRRASSASVQAVGEGLIAAACGRGAASPRKCPRLLVGEGLDDLVGDVDPLAREHHRILEDEIELLRPRDLLGHLVWARLDGRQA